MADYATRRILMVDTQVRPSDVTKFPIIDAMLNVPRERFVPSALREAAYMGESLPLDGDRVVIESRILAKMLDMLDIRAGDSVLHIGAGLGYGPAVIARIAEFVAGVEDDPARAAAAEGALRDIGADNAAIFAGPLAEGAAKAGPFDVVLIEGGIETLPEAIAAQIKDGGRIAAIWMDGVLGEARLGLKSGERISWRGAFNAAAPVLPGFARVPAFVF